MMTQQPEYATYTKKYRLVKPDDKDFYDVGHINGNMDIIDDTLSELEKRATTLDNTVGNISNLIGKTTDRGSTSTTGSVMAKLNALLDKVTSTQIGIKSVQRGTFVEDPVEPEVETPITIKIATVNPSKTFMIITGGNSAGYAGSPSASRGYVSSLEATSFTYVTGKARSIIRDIKIGYQVVEFY